MIKNFQFILVFLVLFLNSLNAQVTVSLPELIIPAGEDIEVSLVVTGFYNIGALSLTINFNKSVLTFTGTAGLPEGFTVNSVDENIYIAFASLNSVNTGNDTLGFLKFKHITGNTSLSFTEECETANSDGTVLPASFLSGRIIDRAFQTGKLGDRVWIDVNKNGQQDNGEPGLAWVTVDLFDCNNRWISYSITDSAGYFRFPDLAAGEYYMLFSLIEGNAKYNFTSLHSGEDDLIDSDAEIINDSTAKTGCIILSAGESIFNFDAGVYLTGIDAVNDYYLLQNYPNPFNPLTTISFSIPRRESVDLTIYNILGEKVKVLYNDFMEAGYHSVNFDAEGLKSGIYFYRLRTTSAELIGKMVLAR